MHADVHPSTTLELTQKIRDLEAKLRSISGEIVPSERTTQGAVRTENAFAPQGSRCSPSNVLVTHLDGNTEDEEAVDILATAAFNDEPQIDIGCFGKTHNSLLLHRTHS